MPLYFLFSFIEHYGLAKKQAAISTNF